MRPIDDAGVINFDSAQFVVAVTNSAE